MIYSIRDHTLSKEAKRVSIFFVYNGSNHQVKGNPMANGLLNESSPYLLQHAYNPVNWYPWGDEALEKAVREEKPIFLSIGYAACHWCHVMAHESFEDEATASIMNEYFVNIKVDREERPDIDQIYMQAVVALTGQGGWPLSVFLTPDRKPFYGGTYFPPQRRYQMPSFSEVLTSVSRIWREDRDSILHSANQITNHIQVSSLGKQKEISLTEDILRKVVKKLSEGYDWQDGGWGSAPKFPQAMVIDFLLRQATRHDRLALKMAEHALQAMAKGGMYDVIGGGFARYSVDDQWLVPHFEKMLYDNALLALSYLHAYLVTQKPTYARICQETLDFITREMTHPLGGFYSSLDADSEGEEGKYYLWTLDEIHEILSDQDDAQFIITAYGITTIGNFEGSNVLQRVRDDEALSEIFDIPLDSVVKRLGECHQKLLQHRQNRTPPATDDKVLVSWNALMSITFAEAGRYLNRPDYTQQAIRNLNFLLQNLFKDGRLMRSWRAKQANHNAYLEDYAALILALLSLYQSDPNPRWFTQAVALTKDMVTHFRHPSTGFYDTRDDHEDLIFKPKVTQDNAMPSGNSLAAMALLQISSFNGEAEWKQIAHEALEDIGSIAQTYPTSFGYGLSAIDFALGPVFEVALIGDLNSSNFKSLQKELWRSYHPRLIAAQSKYPPGNDVPELLLHRPLVNHQPTAYVCQNFTCKLPVNSVEELRSLLP